MRGCGRDRADPRPRAWRRRRRVPQADTEVVSGGQAADTPSATGRKHWRFGSRIRNRIAIVRDRGQPGGSSDCELATINLALAGFARQPPRDPRLCGLVAAPESRRGSASTQGGIGGRALRSESPCAALGDQDDLADVAPLRNEAMGVGRPVEWEGLGDDWLQLSSAERRDQRLDHAVKASLGVPPGEHVQSEDALVLVHHR
jgi:hypothetical protein